jgi:2-polyprenyl-3-methyl-5-hydroxy-6-metoxy-1,4-benzoquinol methylase
MTKIDNRSIYSQTTLDKKYHESQISNPYESTKEFYKFLNKHVKLKNKKIIDFACGSGANLFYLNKKYSISECVGFDLSNFLLNRAKSYIRKKNIKNISFYNKNLENISMKNLNIKKKYDGITAQQCLSVFDDYESVIKSAKKFKPSFVCVNSLFWDGDLDFKIDVNFLKKKSKKRKIFKTLVYNIYSLKKYIHFMEKNGYKKNIYKKFILNKKTVSKNKKSMGTYTALLNNKKVQVSGPLILDWYFILSQKK